MPLISVIVPAYNEEKNIAACLAALEQQDFARDQYEIVLVNNKSTDRTKAVAQTFSRVRVVDEPKQGYVHALIRGANEAQGSILAFTDADTVVPKDWLSKYWRAYQDQSVVFAGGPASMRPVLWCTPFLEQLFYWGGQLTKMANGYNMSIRRETYRACGGFDPKINFNADAYIRLRAKKYGTMAFVGDNWVRTSSRRWQKPETAWYIAKTLVNIVTLLLVNKTLFYEFGNVRID